MTRDEGLTVFHSEHSISGLALVHDLSLTHEEKNRENPKRFQHPFTCKTRTHKVFIIFISN